MSKKSKQTISRATSKGEVLPKRQASAGPTRTLPDVVASVNDASDFIRSAIGLPDLKRLTDFTPPVTFADEVKKATATLGGVTDFKALLGAHGLKATELARIAAFNRDVFKPVIVPVRGARDTDTHPSSNRAALPGPTQQADVPDSRVAITSAKDIGLLVRLEREKRKLSQQSFADLAGVGRRFISELENGKASLEFDKVVKVAAAAGIDLMAKPR